MDLSTLSLREKVAQTAIILHSKDRFVDEPVGGVFIGAQSFGERALYGEVPFTEDSPANIHLS